MKSTAIALTFALLATGCFKMTIVNGDVQPAPAPVLDYLVDVFLAGWVYESTHASVWCAKAGTVAPRAPVVKPAPSGPAALPPSAPPSTGTPTQPPTGTPTQPPSTNL